MLNILFNGFTILMFLSFFFCSLKVVNVTSAQITFLETHWWPMGGVKPVFATTTLISTPQEAVILAPGSVSSACLTQRVLTVNVAGQATSGMLRNKIASVSCVYYGYDSCL